MELPHKVRRVLASVLGPAGSAPQALRVAAADRATALCHAEPGPSALPDGLAAFVDKVSLTPYRVVDGDVEALTARGLSEDDIFELTVATALGSARGRFEAALALLEEDAS